MSDNLRTRIAAAIYEASDEYTRKLMVNPRLPGCDDVEGDSKPICFVLADAVIRELPELQMPQRIMLSFASQEAESRRLDAASWLEKELASAGLECGAGWVLYGLIDGLVARLNGTGQPMNDDHSTSFIDPEGVERCSTCDKWLEPGYYTIEDHCRAEARKAADE